MSVEADKLVAVGVYGNPKFDFPCSLCIVNNLKHVTCHSSVLIKETVICRLDACNELMAESFVSWCSILPIVLLLLLLVIRWGMWGPVWLVGTGNGKISPPTPGTGLGDPARGPGEF